jgi:hypothetical protein
VEFITALAPLSGVFAWAFFSFWTAIPAGIALGISPLLVAITAWLSYTVGAVVVILAGEPLRQWIARRSKLPTQEAPTSPLRRAWDRFGIWGLAILAPMTTGSQIGGLVGLSLGVPARRLAFALSAGGLAWSVLITLITVVGKTVLTSVK